MVVAGTTHKPLRVYTIEEQRFSPICWKRKVKRQWDKKKQAFTSHRPYKPRRLRAPGWNMLTRSFAGV